MVVEKLRQLRGEKCQLSWLHESREVGLIEQGLPFPENVATSFGCGGMAFFALFPVAANVVDKFINAFGKGWTNRRNMESALKAIGGGYDVLQKRFPKVGLVLIEWTGTWKTERFWGSELRRTHWVAVIDGFVFDANWSGWLPLHIWEEVVVPEVISSIQGATGWQLHTGYDLHVA